jgi:triacylglycerol esterase/lipase EstA (alpha/beta hydrolase family)
LSAAVIAGASVLAMGFGTAGAGADPAAPTPATLADYITAGLHQQPGKPHAKAIALGTGSAGSSGSACTSGSGAGSGNGSGDCYSGDGSSGVLHGGHSSDTVGYGPEMSSFLAAFGFALFNPNVAPPGANDWNCKPTAAHPRPVVLVHGTWENAYDNFAYLSPRVKQAGFCVFTFNYGQSNVVEGGGLGAVLPGANGTDYIADSAKQLSVFVDRVLAATNASKVDVIAHSQGGAMSRQYLKFEGGAAKVAHLVTLGATNHGTSLDGIGSLGRAINNLGIDILGPIEILVGHSGIEQTVGSQFELDLNKGGDTMPGVDYTIIATRYDEVTNPYPLTFLKAGPGATVHNVTLQDGCEQDLSDHLTMSYSPHAVSVALHALDPSQPVVCTFNPWLVGGSGKL